MNRKFYFSFVAFALTLVAAVAFVVGSNRGTSAASGNAALAALPASDFVISIDVQRALNETLPSLFASSPALLAKMNTELGKFERETGINPRSFESIAIGGRLTSSRPHDSRTVVIARGSFNSDALLENAFAAAKAKGKQIQKEEQVYEGKRIILISPTRKMKAELKPNEKAPYSNEKPSSATLQVEAVVTTPPAGSVAGIGPSPGKDAKRQPLEVLEGTTSFKGTVGDKMAIAVLDANTLAIGDLESVRTAVDASFGRNRVDDELVRLATQTPGAIVGFSGKIPQSVAEKSSASKSTFEKYFASIRQFYGSFSSNGTDAETLVAVRTETTEQANVIGQALNAIKSFSGFGFAQSSGGNSAKNDFIADILKGLTITTQGNEVQINLRISQESLAPLMRIVR
jgi:hypothetical protein